MNSFVVKIHARVAGDQAESVSKSSVPSGLNPSALKYMLKEAVLLTESKYGAINHQTFYR
jgi:hypothetical protein